MPPACATEDQRGLSSVHITESHCGVPYKERFAPTCRYDHTLLHGTWRTCCTARGARVVRHVFTSVYFQLSKHKRVWPNSSTLALLTTSAVLQFPPPPPVHEHPLASAVARAFLTHAPLLAVVIPHGQQLRQRERLLTLHAFVSAYFAASRNLPLRPTPYPKTPVARTHLFLLSSSPINSSSAHVIGS